MDPATAGERGRGVSSDTDKCPKCGGDLFWCEGSPRHGYCQSPDCVYSTATTDRKIDPEVMLPAALHRIRGLEVERKQAREYLERLFVHVLREHFPENTVTLPLSGDLIGIITQIDNVLTGWRELEARCETLELTVRVLESDKQTRNDALDHERARIAAKDEALRLIVDGATQIAREALKK